VDESESWSFTPRQQELYERVLKELEELRRHRPGRFGVNGMFRTPELVRLLGAGHPLEAYTALEELVETKRFNSADVQAAQTTLYSFGDNIDERMKRAGDELQLTARNARPYSNRGLQIIARWIVIDLTFASPMASPQYEVAVLPTDKGRITLDIQARGAKNGGIDRPYWIEIDRRRLSFKDADILYETLERLTLRWEVSAKLPSIKSVEPGQTALEIVIAFRTLALPKLFFSDEFGHTSFRVLFTSRRNMAYVQVIRR
jgi:hypothetical protein